MNGDCAEMELQEILLYSSRHGDITMVQELLSARRDNKIVLDISCKGKSKSNLGWTPLHLSTYFGHRDVAEELLAYGADINAVNDAGDTSLHKAAFIGREDLVLLLLQHNADVNVVNGEGQTPRDVAKLEDVTKLLHAAEQTEARRKEEHLLAAAREGDLDTLKILLKDHHPPNINCVDAQGNSSLHCASYRGHKEAAVLLLQNGIDTGVRNTRGQTALELAQDSQMQQVLCVRPVRQLQKSATRFEGQLLKRSRFLGWKPIWAVLERGVLTYFGSRADAASGFKRKDFKYLDGANILPLECDTSTFVVRFSDSAVHRLSVVNYGETTGQISRQKWINAFTEHAAFSTHYLTQGHVEFDDSDDEDRHIKPLGSMQDSLQTAAAHHKVMESQLTDSVAIVEALSNNSLHCDAITGAAVLRFQLMSDTAGNMLQSLGHCLSLFEQQEEVRVLQLKQEQEKCRVLEEALSVLAKEHHELEQSMASHLSTSPSLQEHRSLISSHRSPRFYDTSDDEFYDAFEADSDSDTLVTAVSPTSDSDTLVSFPSPASSCGTLVSAGGHAYRCARDNSAKPALTRRHVGRHELPVPMFSRNDFSIWSVLKNCIGKELSKITMPVIFNEPLSFLQRMVEYMEYAHLLRRAAEEADPIYRMQVTFLLENPKERDHLKDLGIDSIKMVLGVVVWVSLRIVTIGRLLVVCEQVSHHPPVSAFHADCKDFIFHGSIHPKLKFWGKSVEIQPKGQVTVELPRWGEAYTWTNVNCCVHNIIVGKLWMEQYGTMEVTNHVTGLRAILTFKPAGWFSKDLHRVEGFITDKHKKKLHFLYGKWTEFIRCTDIPSYDEYVRENAHKFRRDGDKGKGATPNDSPSHTPKKVLAKLNSFKVGPFKSNSQSEGSVDEGCPIPDVAEGELPKCDSTYSIDIPNSVTLWEADPRPDRSSEYYQFTLFAMSLNEMEEGMKSKLCPTDCRFRPDIRKLEEGDIDGAAAEKTRLEEKQRDARKARKGKKGLDWAPRWFTPGTNPHTKQEDWLYSGGYWDRNFSGILDIF
ncbi:oxysterol-binding protein-related protein 1-like [Zootermopsis nevadensis]|uniref:oxysterol-binding protein-related protein 1-like n=1 Tax=Zootermopsis nevadensis TaxID=136037 RepID=UPI000B8E59B1|nr:oxysterol-binding protein-related protein 1-like [Zootermopsis nevadensis]